MNVFHSSSRILAKADVRRRCRLSNLSGLNLATTLDGIEFWCYAEAQRHKKPKSAFSSYANEFGIKKVAGSSLAVTQAVTVGSLSKDLDLLIPPK